VRSRDLEERKGEKGEIGAHREGREKRKEIDCERRFCRKDVRKGAPD
jgi:hypothetical protein